MNKSIGEETAFVVSKRFEMYEFLSFAFLNTPSEDILNSLRNNAKFLKEINPVNADFLYEKSMDDFVEEYYDRFFVTTSKLFVPSHESSIRNIKIKKGKTIYGKLDSDETFHVKACYEMVDFKVRELNGFSPLKDNHYPDHISFELAFMAYLARFELTAVKCGDEENSVKWKKLQKNFLEEHLNKWIGDYAELTEKKGKGMYSYLSCISAAWTDMDLEYLNEEVINDREVI